MAPSPEGWPTKAKESPSPHEVRVARWTPTQYFKVSGFGFKVPPHQYFIETPSLEGLPTKAKEDPCPHEMILVRMLPKYPHSGLTLYSLYTKMTNLCLDMQNTSLVIEQ